MSVSGSILDCHRKEANGVTYVAGYFYWTTCTIAPAGLQDFSGVLLFGSVLSYLVDDQSGGVQVRDEQRGNVSIHKHSAGVIR